MIELDSEQKKEIAVRLEAVGNKILFAARDELYLGMRFLDVALSSFLYQMDITVNPFGTDGSSIYFHPQYLGGDVQRKQDSGKQGVSAHGIPLHFPAHGQTGTG